jgi:hypothetical protein
VSETDTTGKSHHATARHAVTRRRLFRSGMTAVAAVSGTAAALYPVLTGRQPGDTAASAAAAPGGPQDGRAPAVEAAGGLFDEVYRGRRIRGFPDPGEDGVAITVDGMPLPVMRRADGSWISTADHYQPYTTPLATARGAVDVIGGAALSPDAAHHHRA